MATSLISKLGSGDMTVLAENSTLLPLKLPLKRPYFPFTLYNNPLEELKEFFMALASEHSELMY